MSSSEELSDHTEPMTQSFQRRDLLKSLALLPALYVRGRPPVSDTAKSARPRQHSSGCELKVALNAFSFNEPLSKGQMTLDDMLDFCAENCFAAVDLTGYYFPGYPDVPSDEYIYHIKRKAFRLGLDISGTGIRNNFAHPDPKNRRADIQLIRGWVEVAAKLGAPVIRIFAGQPPEEQYDRDEILEWMVKDISECVAYGKQRGVVIGVQNHNDFIRDADQALQIMSRIDSEWCGLVLDTGSYRVGDPYEEIRATASYAVNWQVKEMVYVAGVEAEPDYSRIVEIIRDSGYRGYLPIETLGEGDPVIKVKRLLESLRNAIHQASSVG
jgi:sugar phosphate isomerase/epimerase